MALIKEPIACDDVRWSGSPIWCPCQGFWTGAGVENYLILAEEMGILICTAHMETGRVFTCGFTGPRDVELKHCSDYWANIGRHNIRPLHAAG